MGVVPYTQVKLFSHNVVVAVAVAATQSLNIKLWSHSFQSAGLILRSLCFVLLVPCIDVNTIKVKTTPTDEWSYRPKFCSAIKTDY